jgi:hypothetical protein
MNVLENPRAILQLEWRLLRLPYTIFEAITARNEHPQTRQEEARLAFLEDLMGRARGVAGFVMGDDDMIARGQIERAKAALRLEAVTRESIAELRERAADQKLREERDLAEEGRVRAAKLEASRKGRALADASKSKAQIAARAAGQRGATRLTADAHRAALEEAEGRAEREYAGHLRDAAFGERSAELAKQNAEELQGARKARKS